jgi:spore coat polysaccharide biosynthesis protein SpsF
MFSAATEVDAETVVRITGDCPLIDPDTIDRVVTTLNNSDANYVSNIDERSFPRGLDVEAFTMDSFEAVEAEATRPSHREHVTPYYREYSEEFSLVNITSDEVFDEEYMRNRTDLRLTLDEAADYELLRTIFENVALSCECQSKRSRETQLLDTVTPIHAEETGFKLSSDWK